MNRRKIYEMYKDYCQQNNLKIMAKCAFQRAWKQLERENEKIEMQNLRDWVGGESEANLRNNFL